MIDINRMDELILVDSDNNVTGYAEKESCHLIPTSLHRAFSIFIFNSKGEMLVQKRSRLKKTWPGFWSNACCSHPRRGERTEDAATGRLQLEMGFTCPLKYLFHFQYQSEYDDTYGENEVDHVFLGLYDGTPDPNSDEVEDWRSIRIQELLKDVERHQAKYTPWFKIALPLVASHLPQDADTPVTG
jgi:isopentenyl-diphosphate delta-isomerase